MSYETILYEQAGDIATITINRPKSLNALNSQVLQELRRALEEIAENQDIRVLILTGAGEKAFVAGADIGELSTLNPLQARYFAKNGHAVMNKLQELPVPVIAAVNGFALGGGLEIALSCDFVYASENAKIGLPEINLGIIPGFGGTQRLARIVGKNLAKEMIFTGKMMSAEEAGQKGIINRVLPADQLMTEVQKTAAAMASKGRVSLNAAKKSINNGMDVDLASGCEMEINAFALCMASDDAKEGTSAFLEKRTPAFKAGLKG
ncbi:MAG: enoyl-CoA hydratase/isomerase family protein [Thermodesulfobacteriota bacterium]